MCVGGLSLKQCLGYVQPGVTEWSHFVGSVTGFVTEMHVLLH